MKIKLNSKILFFLLIIFSFLNLLDVITAMFILPGESNPIYLLTGSSLILWLIKFFFIFMVFYVYFKNEYPSRFFLYSFIYIIVIGIVMISFGVYSNIMGIINPHIVEQASQMTTGQKVSYYGIIVSLFMIIPYIISMVSFKIYDVIESKIKYEVKK